MNIDINRNDLIKIIFKNLSKLNYKKLNIEKKLKDDLSPVTTVDIINQYIIESSIRYFYPYDKILAEENLDDDFPRNIISLNKEIIENILYNIKSEFNIKHKVKNKLIWHIDPLDGTKGFIDDLVYSVAIAITTENKVVNSGILSFNLDKVNSIFPKIIIVVSSSSEIEILDKNLNYLPIKSNIDNTITIAVSRKHKSNSLNKFLHKKNIHFLELDSQAKYISIILGLTSGYIRERKSCGKNSKDYTWDHLPGIHILYTNGNVVYDYNMNPVYFKNDEIFFDKYIIAAKDFNTFLKIQNILKAFDE